MTERSPKSPPAQWLTGSAIWALTGASALLNAWGWWTSSTGLVAVVLVTLVLSAEVLGVRLAMRVDQQARAKAWLRLGVCFALLAGVLAFNAYSGKRALGLVEANRTAPYLAASAAKAEAEAELARVEAEIAALPALRSDIPGSRLRIVQATRDAELVRLEPRRAAAQAAVRAIEVPPEPHPPIPAGVMVAIVALIEALKALGFWAIGAGHAQPARREPEAEVAADNVVDMPRSPGSALAERRWELQRAREAAQQQP